MSLNFIQVTLFIIHVINFTNIVIFSHGIHFHPCDRFQGHIFIHIIQLICAINFIHMLNVWSIFTYEQLFMHMVYAYCWCQFDIFFYKMRQILPFCDIYSFSLPLNFLFLSPTSSFAPYPFSLLPSTSPPILSLSIQSGHYFIPYYFDQFILLR
jgi:hypothetical protein